MNVYAWGALDLAPLSNLQKKAASVVGLTQNTFKAGLALQHRAPADLLSQWEREEVSTCEAYRLLTAWEAGRLL